MSPAARMRGVATGLLTATLALAAHGAADHMLPGGTAIVVLAVLAATIGALASTIARAAQPGALVMLLSAGQLLGHLVLNAAGHHTGSSAPGTAMLAAHALAVVVGAALIAAGDRLWRALSRAIRDAVRLVCPVDVAPVLTSYRADQPMRSTLLMAASMSHRGPPVSLAR